ncbi:MAG: hypothetical protein A2096_12445 [Spirochaetes bacterium GWF1_41_5]|nr:MAG: hypothetical protein A2096_12445 [Spirochaetes bacterium GWF1_41_5]HBE04672.1 hypothetical protein [Spirochaetia bacterium]
MIITEKLKGILRDENMLRTPLLSYTIKDFQNKEEIIHQILEENKIREAYEILHEYLEKNPQNVIAMYIEGMLFLESENKEHEIFEKFFSVFKNIKRWAVLEYTAKKILSFTESRMALQFLAYYYQETGSEEDLAAIWERLARYDTADPAIPEKIAKLMEKNEKIEEARTYYKLAFSRALSQREPEFCLSLWIKLSGIAPEDNFFFKSHESALLELLPAESHHKLYLELFRQHFDARRFETAYSYLIKLITLNPKDKVLRDKLLELVREQYKNHSQLENYIKLSGLSQVWGAITGQISIFEKHIRYDVGTYIHHKNFGYGMIKDIQGSGPGQDPSLTKLGIDFTGKKNHSMTLRMALNSLVICSENNLHILAAFRRRQLNEIIKNSPDQFFRIILETAGRELMLKDIKALLVPDIFSEKEWPEQWKRMKQAVQGSPEFGTRNNYFFIRAGCESEDEMLERFNNEVDLKSKFRIFEAFYENAADKNSESIRRMLASFAEAVKNGENSAEKLKALVFLLLYKNFYRINIDLPCRPEDLLDSCRTRLFDIYSDLDLSQLRQVLINIVIKKYPSAWPNYLKKFFFAFPLKGQLFILEHLEETDNTSVIREITEELLSQPETYIEHFIWFTKHFFSGKMKNEHIPDHVKFYSCMLNMLFFTHREIERKNDLTNRRRQFKVLHTMLFEENNFKKYLEQAPSSSVALLLEEFDRLLFLENYIKTEIKALAARK